MALAEDQPMYVNGEDQLGNFEGNTHQEPTTSMKCKAKMILNNTAM